MATMFPAEVTSFTTSGEGLTYRFLQRAARPDRDFLCWYEPDIEEREPDFILYSPDCGLVVLEVKDWRIEQIVEADPKTVLLDFGSRRERRKQPLRMRYRWENAITRGVVKGKRNARKCASGVCVRQMRRLLPPAQSVWRDIRAIG